MALSWLLFAAWTRPLRSDRSERLYLHSLVQLLKSGFASSFSSCHFLMLPAEPWPAYTQLRIGTRAQRRPWCRFLGLLLWGSLLSMYPCFAMSATLAIPIFDLTAPISCAPFRKCPQVEYRALILCFSLQDCSQVLHTVQRLKTVVVYILFSLIVVH